MGRLNAPREVPREFYVLPFYRGQDVVLVDKSEHVYPCSPRPHHYAEPLYEVTPAVGASCYGDGCDEVVPDAVEDDGEWTCPSCGYAHDGVTKLDGGMLLASSIDWTKAVKVELDDEYVAPEVGDKEAWCAAIEEASSNHLL